MLFASFEKAKQTGVKVELPKALHIGQAEQSTILIGIDEQAQVFLGSKQVTLKELKQELGLTLKRAPQTQFIIKPDRSVTYAEIVKLMDTLAEVGVEKPLWGVDRQKFPISQGSRSGK